MNVKINYVENKNGKLFSFSRHDYKSNVDDDDNFIAIDGGFDYIRAVGELKEGNIEELMPEIREQFYWAQTLDKKNNRLVTPQTKLLKDLTTEHIVAILIFFTKRLRADVKIAWKLIHLIFLYELKSRLK